MKTYWIVISEQRGPTGDRHRSQQSALDQAIRLCRVYGGDFTVLEAQMSVKKQDVSVTRLSDDMDIPFNPSEERNGKDN